MIRGISECLREWMQDNDMSTAALTTLTGYKSKTSVARLLNGRHTYEGCKKLVECLENAGQLSSYWKKQFHAALETESVGMERVLLYQSISDTVLGMDSEEHVFFPGSILLDFPKHNQSVLYVFGCATSGIDRFMNHILMNYPALSVCHYITREELLVNPDMLRCVILGISHHRYSAILLEQQEIMNKTLSWNIMLLSLPEETRKWQSVIHSNGTFHRFDIQDMDGRLIHLEKELKGLKSSALYQYNKLKDPSDYKHFMESSLRMENKREMSIVRMAPGIQMLPPQLVIDLFAEYLHTNRDPIAVVAPSLRYLYQKRADNFFNSKKPIHLYFSKTGMNTLRKEGVLPDHFFAFRPFSREERQMIEARIRQVSAKASCDLRYIHPSVKMPFSYEVYHGSCVLIYPSKTNYNTDTGEYRELMLKGREFSDLFAGFTQHVVIRNSEKAD